MKVDSGNEELLVPGPQDQIRSRAEESRYPAELAREILTRVGTTVLLRPIKVEDANTIVAFHDHLSDRTTYRRYVHLHPHLSEDEITHFTHVDDKDRMAFVIEKNGVILAVGRHDREPGSTEAEVAFVVTDAFQHHGLGTLLLESLADVAGMNGITTFTAMTLPTNNEMLSVFEPSGFDVTGDVNEDVVEVRFPITSDDTYRTTCTSRHTQAEARALDHSMAVKQLP